MSVYDTKIVQGVSDNLKYLVNRLVEGLSMGMKVAFASHSPEAMVAAQAEIQAVLKANQLTALYDGICFCPVTLEARALPHTNMLVVDSPSRIAPDYMKLLTEIPMNMLGLGPIFVYAET